MPHADPAGDLRELEEWFQALVVRPSLPRGARGARPPSAARRVLPSATLSPDERVAIYARMHAARLFECLAEDYSALRAVAGEALFRRIVAGYLADHPPAGFTLSLLGRALPEWIAGRRSLPRRSLFADVARVEVSITRVFDAPREDPLAPADLAALPPEAWTAPRPRLIGALELLECSHRANAIVRAARHGEPLPPLSRKRTWTVVWRKEHVVWRQDLDRIAFTILRALQQGRSLAEAVVAGEAAHAGSADALQAIVARSFQEWAAEGFFAAIERG